MKLFRISGDDENDCSFSFLLTGSSEEAIAERLSYIQKEEGWDWFDAEELGDV